MNRSISPCAILCAVVALFQASSGAIADDHPKVDKHVVVYREPGRFAGWPANHGIWSWDNEILVGFSRGFYQDRGTSHHIDRDKPEEFLLARSLDGGATWKVESPQPDGIFAGAPGMRHGKMPEGKQAEILKDLKTPIHFNHPDFAFTVRMEDTNTGVSRFFYSYDRGKTWAGPFRLPLFGQKGILGRTDYLVNGPDDCILMLSASKSNGKEGRPLVARTVDGGLTWDFQSFVGPEPSGYAIMPSTVRTGRRQLVTTIRRKDGPRSWIDAYVSDSDGRVWGALSRPEPDAGEGNPPSLIKLNDGRLCLTYGQRSEPFGIKVRLSDDNGKTWSAATYLRDDAGGRDIGYVRSTQRPDGKVVAIYYYHIKGDDPTRFIAATIFDPGKP